MKPTRLPVRPIALATGLCLWLCTPVALGTPPGVEDCMATFPANVRMDRVEDLYIGGQPGEDTLRALVKSGVRVVVNLRTQTEMDDRERVPFDEAALLDELGVRYIHVPVGGATYPWRPEVIDAIRDAIADAATHPGSTALLHCQSGCRTSWASAGYLVRERGLSLDEAHSLVGVLQDDTDDDPFCMLLGVKPTFRAIENSVGAGATESVGVYAAAPAGVLAPATGINAAAIDPPHAVTGYAGAVSSRLFESGPLYIGGQPDEEAFQWFKDQGVSVVINLRTPDEMTSTDHGPGFDETQVLAGMGIDYVALPLGGPEHPWTPATTDALASALASHQGKALIHCAVGWRASLAYGAFMARHRGMELNEALDLAGEIYNSHLPFEGMLGIRIVRDVARDR